MVELKQIRLEDLVIDSEFENLIRKQTPDEAADFEYQMINHGGAHDPIMVCKTGDTIWDREVEPWTVVSIEWFSSKVTQLHCVSPVTNLRKTFSVGRRSLGRIIFLTRDDAKIAFNKEK